MPSDREAEFLATLMMLGAQADPTGLEVGGTVHGQESAEEYANRRAAETEQEADADAE